MAWNGFIPRRRWRIPLTGARPFGWSARSIERRCGLGADAAAYRSVVTPFVERWETLIEEFLAPLHFPRHPLKIAAFGAQAIRSAESFARSWFDGERARALFAGIAGHSLLPLDKPGTAAFGLVLGMLAHAVGWPIARGGSQSVAKALCSYLRALGGEIECNARVDNIDEFASATAVLCDVTPRELLRIAGHRFTPRYRHCLERYRYGPGVFKVDWALGAPIPWKEACCARAATVHVGGSMEEIAASERAAWSGEHSERPFVLLAQPSLFDPSRAPAGRHTAWAYCHVPNGSRESFLERMENQIERFAPGFRETILARHTFTAAEMEQYNANYAGGRHQRRRAGSFAIVCAPLYPALPHFRQKSLHLFGGKSARGRRPRHVRILCGEGGSAGSGLSLLDCDDHGVQSRQGALRACR